ncbi:putative selenium-dependent hydroxylase accessory protein YqeC [Shewanella sp. D64]|uniref:selenium cofactor biosynthesis protein YqeC n=1 Tax=unclassified Shewanella TaxID=196818 RepID=UPI0022BA3495|nr:MULTISPECIES: selenium cofactor biosynthesis protein YqeC [unclassified Shewanella]MEC4727619.1 putative selenium-dependent hydroxylase accessory protein YqeC [Shewanella sp. D64]MEC4739870.1 putative selenium-dependent hydroxylase accessory protein YqeC [Shewanella sp. E94]WBJ95746.1 putative selenium-dependent hydroxylase accessory protein YqeC [Shewanella sp. MTB7]
MLFDALINVCANDHTTTPQPKLSNQAPVSSLLVALVGGGGKSSTAFRLAQQAQSRGMKVLITTTTKMYLPSESQCDTIIDIENLIYQIDSVSDFLDTSSESDTGNKKSAIGSHLNIAESAASETLTYCDINSASRSISSTHYTPLSFLPASLCFCYQNKLELIENKDKNTKEIKVSGLSFVEIEMIKNAAIFDLIIIEADGAKHLPIKAPSRHEPCIPPNVDIVIAVTGCEVINQEIEPALVHRWTDFQYITQCQAGDKLAHQVLARLIAHKDGMFKQVPTSARRVWLINKVDLASNYVAVQTLVKDLVKHGVPLDAIWLASMQAANPMIEVLTRDSITTISE